MSLAEFVVNNFASTSTRKSPFYLSTNKNPKVHATLLAGKFSITVSAVDDSLDRMKTNLTVAHE